MATLTKTVEPTVEPVTVTEQKEHARILHSHEDTYLEGLITLSRAWCEKYLGQSFVTQTWEMKLDCWPRQTNLNPYRDIQLPYGPVQAVSSVQYYNEASTLTTMPSSDYVVTIGNVGRVAPGYNKYWPTTIARPDAITVTWSAGYGGASASTDANASAEAVPPVIKHAIKFYAQHLYQVRDEDAPMPTPIKSLLDMASFGTYRVMPTDSY